MNISQKIKGLKPAHTVAEVVLHTHKANPHHHSHSSANPTVMFQDIQSSYLYGKFHPFPLDLIRRISRKQHGRTNPRLETDWGIDNLKFFNMKNDKSLDLFKKEELSDISKIMGGAASGDTEVVITTNRTGDDNQRPDDDESAAVAAAYSVSA